jgi:hypothetical protein
MKLKYEVNVPYMKVNRKKETASNMKERMGGKIHSIIISTTL